MCIGINAQSRYIDIGTNAQNLCLVSTVGHHDYKSSFGANKSKQFSMSASFATNPQQVSFLSPGAYPLIGLEGHPCFQPLLLSLKLPSDSGGPGFVSPVPSLVSSEGSDSVWG